MEDNSWVFDSLVCFLHGPIWNAPLQTFIEEKSIVFDPNEKIDDSNPEFKAIHDEYKNLVDYMLGSFMDEMQITPVQFEVACLEGRHIKSSNGNGAEGGSSDRSGGFNFHHGLFQQIWAANDIRIFIRMMTQRNVELQLQALDLIERRQLSADSSKEEENMMDFNHLPLENVHETKIPNEKTYSCDDTFDDDISIAKEAVEIDHAKEEFQDKYGGDLASSVDEKFQRLNLFFEKDHINSADIKSRQEYLRNQRDKILEIKKKARTRELNESVKKNGRPSSAQIAQKLMQGEMESEIEPPPESSMVLRKTLAKRLRTEVVDTEAGN